MSKPNHNNDNDENHDNKYKENKDLQNILELLGEHPVALQLPRGTTVTLDVDW